MCKKQQKKGVSTRIYIQNEFLRVFFPLENNLRVRIALNSFDTIFLFSFYAFHRFPFNFRLF